MKTKENAWANAYADFVLRNRWVIIILLVAATIVAALQIHKLDIRNDPDTLLPDRGHQRRPRQGHRAARLPA